MRTWWGYWQGSAEDWGPWESLCPVAVPTVHAEPQQFMKTTIQVFLSVLRALALSILGQPARLWASMQPPAPASFGGHLAPEISSPRGSKHSLLFGLSAFSDPKYGRDYS